MREHHGPPDRKCLINRKMSLNRTEDEHFRLFYDAMKSFSDFEVENYPPGSKFSAWRNLPPPPKTQREKYAMIDPPSKDGRKYCQVERRSVFESGFEQNGLIVQLEIHETPVGLRRTAVYIQSKEYPPSSLNIGNLTFKFKQEQGNFLVEFRQSETVAAFKRNLPLWLPSSALVLIPGKMPRAIVQVGSSIDPKLVQLLLLLADFSGQARQNSVCMRDTLPFCPTLDQAQ
jgi:hypothetical protein